MSVAESTVECASARQLGALSERFESGGLGPGAVSSGRGDPGGVSYGLYQLASRTGTTADFLAAEGAPWRAAFGQTAPGTPEFSAIWRRVATDEAERFADAQRRFIARTHYAPVATAVQGRCKLDLSHQPVAVRAVAWSCAVQHRAAARIIIGAIAATDAALARDHANYGRALIHAIYAARADYVRGLAARVRGPARGQLLSIVERRYPAECAAALDMLAAPPPTAPA